MAVTRFIRVCLIFLSLHFNPTAIGLSQQIESQPSNGDPITLTLTAAINLALRDNRNLLRSGLNINNQQLSVDAARSEFDFKIRPFSSAGVTDGEKIIGGGVGVGKKFDLGLRATLSPGVEWTENEYTGTTGVSLSIPLLKGFGKEANLDAIYGSQFALRTAERTIYKSRANVVLDTVATAYDITKQSELVKLFEFQRDQFEEHAATARIKESVGLATPIDIYRAEIRKKDAENSLSATQESLSNAKDRLKLILSLSLAKDIHVTTPMSSEPFNITSEDAVNLALAQRIEIDQRKDDIAEARRNTNVSKHNLLPRLDLVMDYQRFGFSDEFDESVVSGDDRWAINLSSDTDWARRREKIAFSQSMLNIQTAQINLAQQQDQIKREVRQQWQALDKDLERIHIRREQVKQAEAKLALAKIKFNYGMADNFDVIEAETDRQRAKVDLLSTEIDYIVGTYRMRSVLGTLLQR